LALPSYYFLVKWLPASRAIIVLLVFSVFPIVIEAIGISTGLPYGGFHYSDEMGFKILGLVPWSVSFAFAPLIIGSAAITNRQIEDARLALPASALLLVMFDLILDPAAVVLNIWVWDVPGPYYGIPISNYTGWFLTGLVAAVLLHLMLMETPMRTVRLPTETAASLLLIISFWTGFSFWTSLIVPAAIGLVMMVYLVYVIGSA
ncbi:MAG: carotenoid biosynthesis protein, partial [Candidatus Thorarchaeota archaeon]